MTPTIIFDMGGVLVRLDWDKACAPLTRLSDLTYDEVMKEVQNGPIVESSMLGRLTPQEFHRAICDEIHVAIDFDPFIEIWNSILGVDNEMADLVEELASTHTLVIASNTDAIHFPYSLENFSALKAFGRHFLSCEMGLLKPDPAYFHHVLYELWASPANCVFIDDRLDNVRAARNVGINGLVFESVEKLKSDLSSIL
jgi:HAD superfamily hydrolase (TIGR01509 family)